MSIEDKYQIQGMMMITGVEVCDLVTAKSTNVEETFHVEPVKRDENFIRRMEEEDIKSKMC